jgi:hypothetical protein
MIVMFRDNPNGRLAIVLSICMIVAIFAAIIIFGQWPGAALLLLFLILSISAVAWKGVTSSTPTDNKK